MTWNCAKQNEWTNLFKIDKQPKYANINNIHKETDGIFVYVHVPFSNQPFMDLWIYLSSHGNPMGSSPFTELRNYCPSQKYQSQILRNQKNHAFWYIVSRKKQPQHRNGWHHPVAGNHNKSCKLGGLCAFSSRCILFDTWWKKSHSLHLILKLIYLKISIFLDDIRRLSAYLPCFFKSHIHNHDTLSGFFVKTTLTNDMSKRNKNFLLRIKLVKQFEGKKLPRPPSPWKMRPTTTNDDGKPPGVWTPAGSADPKSRQSEMFFFFRWCFGIKCRRGSKKTQLDWWSWVMILIHGQLVQLWSFMVFRWYYLEAEDNYPKWP